MFHCVSCFAFSFVKCCKLFQQFHLSRFAPQKDFVNTFRGFSLFCLTLNSSTELKSIFIWKEGSERAVSQRPHRRHGSWTPGFLVGLMTSKPQVRALMKEPEIFALNHKKCSWEAVVRAEDSEDLGCHSNDLRQLTVAKPSWCIWVPMMKCYRLSGNKQWTFRPHSSSWTSKIMVPADFTSAEGSIPDS